MFLCWQMVFGSAHMLFDEETLEAVADVAGRAEHAAFCALADANHGQLWDSLWMVALVHGCVASSVRLALRCTLFFRGVLF